MRWPRNYPTDGVLFDGRLEGIALNLFDYVQLAAKNKSPAPA